MDIEPVEMGMIENIGHLDRLDDLYIKIEQSTERSRSAHMRQKNPDCSSQPGFH